ncbi:gamma-glutamyl-gamma-aminobutyrate hydrolase family protein [Paenibacillus durus]|uniref:gamma-glutamyl-gamma-aminobutyrate hydrolase family protein n=1 Tax=Paenibacillus durus TaxID=44251 RepID=UPI000AF2C7AE|nr:gamma-glutamyl-gamma-aminobutyrate hydrolase family protein [Paenibacillus durus]
MYDRDKESYWMLPGYMKGIEAAGGIPFILPLTSDIEIITKIANMFDGFLFTGGHDVNPEIYGENVEDVCGELCNERDDMETALFKQVVDLDKPAFGICRGIQLFNALLGGTLYQDLPTQFKSGNKIEHKQAPPYSVPVHNVYIEKGNPLYRIIETENFKVNSYHHQGIKELSDQLISVAKAEDGLIEAVIMPQKNLS